MAKKIDKWATVRDQIAAGSYPRVFVAADGRLALDGKGRTLPPDIAALFPADVRQAAETKATQVATEKAARDEAARAAYVARADLDKAVCDRYRNVRAWRLAGFYMDELSTASYTLAEIESWLDWDACNLRHKRALVSAVLARPEADGGDYHLDLSEHFFDACNDSRGAPAFETLCQRLADHVAESWSRNSVQN